MRGVEAVQRLTRWRWFPFVSLVSVALAFVVLALTLVPETLAGGEGSAEDRSDGLGADRGIGTAAKGHSSRFTPGRPVRSPTPVSRVTASSPEEESDTEPLDEQGDEYEQDDE